MVELLDNRLLFELLQIPFPVPGTGLIEKLISEKLVMEERSVYSITNLGALLFAKKINHFPSLIVGYCG